MASTRTTAWRLGSGGCWGRASVGVVRGLLVPVLVVRVHLVLVAVRVVLVGAGLVLQGNGHRAVILGFGDHEHRLAPLGTDQGVVEDLISDRIVLRWAAERKPQGDESFRHAAKHIDEELSLAALSDQIHEEQLTVSESDLRAYYDANRAALAGQTFEEAREGISRTLKARREPDYVASYVERLRSNASITRNYDLLRVPSPTDDELRRYYDENRDSFKLTRRVIVDELAFPIGSFGDAARQKAADALLRIRGGATFSEASADKEGTRMASGREVAEGTEAPEWETAVFALVPGELASVFQAEDAFYVVRLVDSRPARSRELSEVRAEVAEAVARRKEEAWFAANGDKTLFTIKSERYNLGQFYDEFRELPRGLRLEYSAPDGMKRLADDLIDRMLLVSDTYDQLLDVKTRPQADESRLRLMAQMMEQEEVDFGLVAGDVLLPSSMATVRARPTYKVPRVTARFVSEVVSEK